MNHISKKFSLVVGGAGQLGKHIVKVFKQTHSVASMDVVKNDDADFNIIVDGQQNPKDQINQIKQNLNQFSTSLNSIICVSGGFMMGSFKDNDIFEKYSAMINNSLNPALIAGHLGAHYLNENGLIVFTGSKKVAQQPCTDLAPYALSKTAVTSLALFLSKDTDSFPKGTSILTILPDTIDTPTNRQFMPDADFSKWQNPEQIAQLLNSWSMGFNRPTSGSMVVLKTQNNNLLTELI